MGESGEAQNITHQQKKMSHDSIRQLPRPLRHPGRRRQARGGALRHVRRRLARARVHARAADGARRLSARAARQGRRARHAGARRLRALPQEHRGPRDLDDDGVRADPAAPAARQEPRQAHRADRSRRIAHVRHGGPVPAARHLEPAGAALHAAGFRPARCSTRRSKDGQILQEGINEAGGMCDWIAAATSLLDARRADDPVLHLLLDVRLPARRRPRVGGGRHALRAASCSAAPRDGRR